jgi:hypothetical protein
MASKDKRRTDVRVPVNSEPFWLTSAIITSADTGVDAVLADFKALDGTFIVLSGGVEVIEAFDGSASLTVGLGTMATPTIGTVTAVDNDLFFISADVTEAAVGYYPQVGGQFATDLGLGKAEVIKGADTTVPVVYAVMSATNPTVGKARVHLLLSKVPVM